MCYLRTWYVLLSWVVCATYALGMRYSRAWYVLLMDWYVLLSCVVCAAFVRGMCYSRELEFLWVRWGFVGLYNLENNMLIKEDNL